MQVSWRAASDYVVVLTKQGGATFTDGKSLCEASLNMLSGTYEGPYLPESTLREVLEPTYRSARCQCNVLTMDEKAVVDLETHAKGDLNAIELLYQLKLGFKLQRFGSREVSHGG